MRPWCLRLTSAVGLALFLLPRVVSADEIPEKYRATINKGLNWLAASQFNDGHWEGSGGQWQVPLTALSSMALLMEGSTVHDGKYCHSIRRARDWLLKRQQFNGLIGSPQVEQEGGRYMYGHGFATLFLACLVGEEEDVLERARLADAVEKACQFIRHAQTRRGGWGYVTAKDSNDWDEGSVTITQMQALRAARNAGVVVPPDAVQNGLKYLRDSTNEEGGVIYSAARTGDVAQSHGDTSRPALTAAAIACGFSAGEYQSPIVKRWLRFCQSAMSSPDEDQRTHFAYTHYYYAQTVYMLGEDRWRKMFPDAQPQECLRWSQYRESLFDQLCKKQKSDGCWHQNDAFAEFGVGPVFTTACYLGILQLDKAVLPIYQR